MSLLLLYACYILLLVNQQRTSIISISIYQLGYLLIKLTVSSVDRQNNKITKKQHHRTQYLPTIIYHQVQVSSKCYT